MKGILIALLALTVGVSGVFAAGPLGDDVSNRRTIPLATNPASSTTTTETGVDIPGPCDEPEHADDPRCAGVGGSTSTTTTIANMTTTTETRGREAREPGEDLRGPCDEAEHANDPRCVGGAATRDDDRRGHDDRRGSDDRGGDDGRRGSNSGPSGSDDSGSGSSGRGGDDDRSGSNSGSGSDDD